MGEWATKQPCSHHQEATRRTVLAFWFPCGCFSGDLSSWGVCCAWAVPSAKTRRGRSRIGDLTSFEKRATPRRRPRWQTTVTKYVFDSEDCPVNPPFFMSRASRGWKSVSLGCYFLRLRMKSRGVLSLTKSSLTDDRVTQRRRAADLNISSRRVWRVGYAIKVHAASDQRVPPFITDPVMDCSRSCQSCRAHLAVRSFSCDWCMANGCSCGRSQSAGLCTASDGCQLPCRQIGPH